MDEMNMQGEVLRLRWELENNLTGEVLDEWVTDELRALLRWNSGDAVMAGMQEQKLRDMGVGRVDRAKFMDRARAHPWNVGE